MKLNIYSYHKIGGYPIKTEIDNISTALPIFEYGNFIGFKINQHQHEDEAKPIIYRIPVNQEVTAYEVELKD